MFEDQRLFIGIIFRQVQSAFLATDSSREKDSLYEKFVNMYGYKIMDNAGCWRNVLFRVKDVLCTTTIVLMKLYKVESV